MYLVQRLGIASRVAAPVLSKNAHNSTLRRHAHIVYRQFPKPPKHYVYAGEFLMAAAWFWFLWRFYHEPEDVFGHYPVPDPSKWTDDELGIPPDDED